MSHAWTDRLHPAFSMIVVSVLAGAVIEKAGVSSEQGGFLAAAAMCGSSLSALGGSLTFEWLNWRLAVACASLVFANCGGLKHGQ
jgi:hypothetical protein